MEFSHLLLRAHTPTPPLTLPDRYSAFLDLHFTAEPPSKHETLQGNLDPQDPLDGIFLSSKTST